MDAKGDASRAEVPPIDEAIDHVRGPAGGRLILEYGDYECPYSRAALRAIERVERDLAGRVRFAFRHFPLHDIHPIALGAAAAAEAAALQGRLWEMHERLFHRQGALGDDDLRRYAAELGLDLGRFDEDRAGRGRSSGAAATSGARWRPGRSAARRPCSSTAGSTRAITTGWR